MCMLCVVPPNVLPDREKLTYSAINNPDGFGFAIVVSKEKRIITYHTMDPDDAVNEFLKMRAEYPSDYALWHARLATHGSTNLDNCHPFKVADSMTVLAHNGILPIDIPTGDWRSDTRIFAEEVLAKIGGVSALDNPHIYNILEEYTSGSKVCVLTVDPKAEYQMYLLHDNKGTTDESGVWWSNDSCSPSYGWQNKWYSKSELGSFYTTAENTYDNEEWPCVGCQTHLVEDDLIIHNYVCQVCDTCQWCDMNTVNCMCYKKMTYEQSHKAYSTAWEF